MDRLTRTRPIVRGAALALLIAAAACGTSDDGPGAEAGAAPDAAATGPGHGTLVMNGDSHAFFVSTCDLEAADDDDVILRGSGTTVDDTRLRVQLERTPGDAGGVGEVHNVFVMFGGLTDGEAWSAIRRTGADGGWYVGEVSGEPAPGPLIEVDGRSVSVTGTLATDGGVDTAEAEIRAECPESGS